MQAIARGIDLDQLQPTGRCDSLRAPVAEDAR
jgi:hypothetical protein